MTKHGKNISSKGTISPKTPENDQEILQKIERDLENLSTEIQDCFLLKQANRIEKTKGNPVWRFADTIIDLTKINFDKFLSSLPLADQELLLEIEKALTTFPIEMQEKFLTGQLKRIEIHVRPAEMPVERSPTTYFTKSSIANKETGVCVLVLGLFLAFYFVSPNTQTNPTGKFNLRKELEDQKLTYDLSDKDQTLIIDKFVEWSEKKTNDPVVVALVGTDQNVKTYAQERLSLLKKVANNIDPKIVIMNQTITRVDLYEHFANELSTENAPSLAIVLDIEKLKWDSPLTLHAWGEDGQSLDNPPAKNSLIILGVSAEEKMTESCEEFFTTYLTKKWIANGGREKAIIPIINKRIDHVFCF